MSGGEYYKVGQSSAYDIANSLGQKSFAFISATYDKFVLFYNDLGKL